MLPVFAEVQKLKDVGIIPKKARPSPALCHADHRRGWPRGGACRRQPAGRHNRAKQDRLPKVARRVSVANQPLRGRQLCPHRAKTDHRALGFAAHTFTQVCPRPAGAGLTPSPLRCGSSLPSAISALLRFSFQRFRFSAFQPFCLSVLRPPPPSLSYSPKSAAKRRTRASSYQNPACCNWRTRGRNPATNPICFAFLNVPSVPTTRNP